MKITIEFDDRDINKLSKSHELISTMNDNNPHTTGMDGISDVCKNCPNRPGGPNNRSGYCMCTLPYYVNGPRKVTC